MTKFEELQARHAELLEHSQSPADANAFVAQVQREIQNMCTAAEDIPAPRDRDQLRAILRFWASYVYDHTGTYPDTTLLPAKAAPPPPPPPRRSLVIWGIAALAVIATIIAAMAFGRSISPMSAAAEPTKFAPVSTPGASTNLFTTPDAPTVRPLEIESSLLTAGPSPFDPNVWAARLQLTATGGNGTYIFWVNGVHLPDIGDNQLTVEGAGCEPEKPIVGVTSGGQATSKELVIQSPLPECRK
jgi:hypothetical protein